MTWRNCISQSSGAVGIVDIDAYVLKVKANNDSAIDKYYAATEAILLQAPPSFFQTFPSQISALLYIGLISATENYIRDVLGFVLSVCPIARKKAAVQKVQLGSFLWGGAELHRRTAFDFISFSSSENIGDALAKFAGFQARTNSTLRTMLDEYDNLCEIRHGIVHSGHVLSGKNALNLGVAHTDQVMLVNPTYATFQEWGSICTTLVQSVNNELFEALVKRWAVDWRKLATWQKPLARKRLHELYNGFLSRRDQGRGAIGNSMSFETLHRRVKKEFNL